MGSSSTVLSHWPGDKPSAGRGLKRWWEGAVSLSMGMAPAAAGTVVPPGSSPPRPPHAHPWCERVRALQLSASSLAASSATWKTAEGICVWSGLGTLSPPGPCTARMWIWGQSCPRTGSPCLCHEVEPLPPAQIPLSSGTEKGEAVREGHSLQRVLVTGGGGRWWDVAVPCPQQLGTSSSL